MLVIKNRNITYTLNKYILQQPFLHLPCLERVKNSSAKEEIPDFNDIQCTTTKLVENISTVLVGSFKQHHFNTYGTICIAKPRSLTMYSTHYIYQIYMMNENHCPMMEMKIVPFTVSM